MKRVLGFGLMLLFVLTGALFTMSCAKKSVQSEPSTQTEQATMEEEDNQAQTEEEQNDQQALEEERLAEEKARLEAEQQAMAAKEKFETEDIHFNFDSSVILSEAQSILQEKAEWINANPDAKIVVEGHCDERGTEAYNLALGERRAEAARNYLINLGVDPARLTAISYGEERPIDPMENESAWAKNRRAHFTVE